MGCTHLTRKLKNRKYSNHSNQEQQNQQSQQKITQQMDGIYIQTKFYPDIVLQNRSSLSTAQPPQKSKNKKDQLYKTENYVQDLSKGDNGRKEKWNIKINQPTITFLPTAAPMPNTGINNRQDPTPNSSQPITATPQASLLLPTPISNTPPTLPQIKLLKLKYQYYQQSQQVQKWQYEVPTKYEKQCQNQNFASSVMEKYKIDWSLVRVDVKNLVGFMS